MSCFQSLRVQVLGVILLLLPLLSTLQAQNNALNFDGSGDNVFIPANGRFNFRSGDFTVELYARFSVFSTAGLISGWEAGSSTNGFSLYTNSSGLVVFAIGNGSSGTGASASGLSLGTWYHIAGVRQGNTMRIYVNGTLMNTNSTSRTLTNNLPIRIGSRYSNNLTWTHNGEIDEVRIWNVARSQAQLSANMSTGLNGNEPGLVAYYTFDEGVACGSNASVTTLPDQTSNGLNGTLQSFSLGSNGCVSNWTDQTPNFQPAPSGVPTLSQWGVIILALMIVSLGAIRVRQRQFSAGWEGH